MATLAANKPRVYETSPVDEFGELPAAVDILFEGSAATSVSGYVEPLATTEEFFGFVDRKCDNSGGSAGDKNVRLRTRGYIVVDVTGVTAVTDVGDTVYMTDDDTFTLTPGSDKQIGTIVRWISGTKCVVYFESILLRSI